MKWMKPSNKSEKSRKKKKYPPNLALSLPTILWILLMYDCQTWWIYASQKSKVIYDPLFFLSLPSNKATQTIFVMTKVYIFAIAKHHSTAPFFFLYWKKKLKKFSPKKRKTELKTKKIWGEGEMNMKMRYRMMKIFWPPSKQNLKIMKNFWHFLVDP